MVNIEINLEKYNFNIRVFIILYVDVMFNRKDMTFLITLHNIDIYIYIYI